MYEQLKHKDNPYFGHDKETMLIVRHRNAEIYAWHLICSNALKTNILEKKSAMVLWRTDLFLGNDSERNNKTTNGLC
jgi:hypothetical protein